MAYPTAVNSQITDAVTQSNVKVTGEAPVRSEADEPAVAEGTDIQEKVETDQHALDRPGHSR